MAAPDFDPQQMAEGAARLSATHCYTAVYGDVTGLRDDCIRPRCDTRHGTPAGAGHVRFSRPGPDRDPGQSAPRTRSLFASDVVADKTSKAEHLDPPMGDRGGGRANGSVRNSWRSIDDELVEPAQCDVWLAAHLDLICCHEQAGARPVIVIRAMHSMQPAGDDALCVSLSSRDRGPPLHVRIQPARGRCLDHQLRISSTRCAALYGFACRKIAGALLIRRRHPEIAGAALEDRGSALTTADGVGVRRSALPRSLFFSVRQTLTSTSSTYQPSMPPQPSIPMSKRIRTASPGRAPAAAEVDLRRAPAPGLLPTRELDPGGAWAGSRQEHVDRACTVRSGAARASSPNADLQAHALRRCLADGLRRVPGHARWIGATGQSGAWATTSPVRAWSLPGRPLRLTDGSSAATGLVERLRERRSGPDRRRDRRGDQSPCAVSRGGDRRCPARSREAGRSSCRTARRAAHRRPAVGAGHRGAV